MNRTYNVFDKVYGLEYKMVIGDESYLEKFMDNEGLEIEILYRTPFTAGIKDEDGLRYTLIYMPEWIGDVEDLKTLMHESIHAGLINLDYVGVDADANNQETIAYYSSFLFAEFLEKLSKKRKK